MTPTFQLVGIDHEQFGHLFSLSDEQLKTHGAERRIARESPGCPCRISLEDARVGEEVLLLPYVRRRAAFLRVGSRGAFLDRVVRCWRAGRQPCCRVA